MEISGKIPTFFVRYEDMRTNPESTMIEVFKFILDEPSLEGTVVEKRILDRCSLKNEPKSIYKLKSTSTNLSRNQELYTPELIDLI